MTQPARPVFRAERRNLITSLAAGALTSRAFAATGKPAQVAWLGWTGAAGLQASALAVESFRAGLKDRGWTEGDNLRFAMRTGDQSSGAALAADLVKLNPDLVVAQGPMVFAARSVIGSRPMLFSINGDPIEAGLVASLARPGGNLTGLSALSADLAGKRLELLKEALGKGTRVALLANSVHPGVKVEHDATLAAARRLGLTVNWYPLKGAGELEGALAAVARDGADALLAVPDNLINRLAAPIAQFATARRLPTMSGWSEFVEAGNLMSYGPDYAGFFRQLGTLADRLLRGASPAQTAVELPREVELVVSQKAARAIGLELPAALLLRADRRLT